MIENFKVIVSGFVYNNKGQLLVIRRSDDEETFPGMLAIPGGTVEVDENSGLVDGTIEQNLVRELKEETNVDVAVEKWFGSSSIASSKAKLYLFFTCSVTGNDIPRISSETPEVFWADTALLKSDECTPALRDYVLSLRV